MTQYYDNAKCFAKSLDDEDYISAVKYFSPNCKYTINDNVYRTPEAIISSYKEAGDSALIKFDKIRYESVLHEREEGAIIVEFIDLIQHKGHLFTHRCEQLLEFNESGLISKITHVDLQGIKEALQSFYKLVGLLEK